MITKLYPSEGNYGNFMLRKYFLPLSPKGYRLHYHDCDYNNNDSTDDHSHIVNDFSFISSAILLILSFVIEPVF